MRMICLTSKPKPPKSAWESALDSLSRRELTRHELERRLTDKGFAGEDVEAALLKVTDYGYLNDREVALNYSQSRLKRHSRRQVILDMQKRGLTADLIEQTLKEVYSRDEESRQCSELARKWWAQEEKHWTDKSAKAAPGQILPRKLWVQQRVAQKLRQRGYPSEMIRSVLWEAGSAEDD